MVSSKLSGLGCLECLDLLVGHVGALPHQVPRHAVHPAPGPSVGDAQILGAAQCRTERQSLQLPSAVCLIFISSQFMFTIQTNLDIAVTYLCTAVV